MAEGCRVHCTQRPITVRHHNRWRQRHAEVTGQQVVVREADRLHRQCRDHWTAHVAILREDQIQDVAADVSWNDDILMQVVRVD